MPSQKKMSQTEMRKYIHSLRGKYKTPNDKPFAEWMAEADEKELEERKYQRLAALGKK